MRGESSNDRGNTDWVWFFAVLTALGIAAVTIPIVYNLRLQLDPVQVAQAHERWRSSGPEDYDLDYLQKYTRDGETDETAYRVAVRGGKVVAVGSDGKLVFLANAAPEALIGPPARALSGPSGARDVDGMFDYIDARLREDADQPRRPYETATFDPRDGHPTRYVRRLRGGAERLEWTVKLSRPGAG